MDTDPGNAGGGYEIRELRGPDEAEAAAAIMAATDPWQRLGRTHAHTLRAVTDPAATPSVAVAPGGGDEVIGVVIVQDLLVFSGYIRALAVRADWRNRRVGRALLAHAERHIFRSSPNVFLCVSSFNEDARRLYQRLGYETIGEIREFIIPGEGEFLMRKTRGPIATYRPDVDR